MTNLPKFNFLDQIHFVTCDAYDFYPYFSNKNYAEIVLEELNFYREKYEFKLLGYVVMPDHIHLLIKLSEMFNDISKVIQGIKTVSAKRVKRCLKFSYTSGKWDDVVPLTLRSDGLLKTSSGFHLWRKKFYDFNIFSEEKFNEKLEYIHNNPINFDPPLVNDRSSYPYSSAGYYDLNRKPSISVDDFRNEFF